MKKETISEALCEIDERYVEEAVAHRPKKKSRLVLRVGAMAASFLIAAGLITTAAFAVRDMGKGDIVGGNIGTYGSVIWLSSSSTYIPPQVQTGDYTTYVYAGGIVSKERVGKLLESAQVAGWNGEDSPNVDIYAIQGVDPTLAVCFVFEQSHHIYYNRELELSTLSELWNLASICENVNFLSANVYEYRTKNTTYCRKYQLADAETEAIHAVLRDLDGEIIPNGKYVWHTPKRIAYLYGNFEHCYERTRIIVEDTGYLTIVMNDAYWSETFHVGVENAVRLIDAIECLPRKEEKEFSTSYEETVTETTHVAETRGE